MSNGNCTRYKSRLLSGGHQEFSATEPERRIKEESGPFSTRVTGPFGHEDEMTNQSVYSNNLSHRVVVGNIKRISLCLNKEADIHKLHLIKKKTLNEGIETPVSVDRSQFEICRMSSVTSSSVLLRKTST